MNLISRQQSLKISMHLLVVLTTHAFVKFGSFMVNTNPIYPERFLEFVVKSGIKLDHWCRDELYDTYIKGVIKNRTS